MILQPGTVAPRFSLADQYGETIALGDFHGVKPVTLVFYPLAFSRTCEGELCALRDNLELFEDAGTELLAISVDSKHAQRAWAEEQGSHCSPISGRTGRSPATTARSSKIAATRIGPHS